jgi:hypothetical protein
MQGDVAYIVSQPVSSRDFDIGTRKRRRRRRNDLLKR